WVAELLCLSLLERWTGSQLFFQAFEVWVRGAPVEIGVAQIEIAQRAANGDIGQAEVYAHAECMFSQATIHEVERGVDFSVLPIHNALISLFGRALVVFHIDEQRSVEHSIGDGFPAFDRSAVAT